MYSVESEIREEAREEALEEGINIGFELGLKIIEALVSQTPIHQIVETLGVAENQVEKMRDAMQ